MLVSCAQLWKLVSMDEASSVLYRGKGTVCSTEVIRSVMHRGRLTVCCTRTEKASSVLNRERDNDYQCAVQR